MYKITILPDAEESFKKLDKPIQKSPDRRDRLKFEGFDRYAVVLIKLK